MSNEAKTTKSRRGFAIMEPERQRALAGEGGRKAHAEKRAHEWTPEAAREAGRKGGKATHAKGTGHTFSPEEARAAGRKGGLAVQAKRAAEREAADKAALATLEPHRPADSGLLKATHGLVGPTSEIAPRITHARYDLGKGGRVTVTPRTVTATGKAAADLVAALGGGTGSRVVR
jgi:uncharacterized protein